ncbi:MAG TPA: MerR family transcriptional regulator [Thermodesulfobacteriota bacterium]|nr:MerR family transcriptional regulator [Thermodesulfobacteriota bacterium]
MSKDKIKKKTKKTKSKVITGLKSKDVIELIEALENIKLDFDHLHYYERTGLIVPSIRKGQGRGIPKLYSVEDFIILRWLVSLQRNGISIQRFRDIIEFLKEKIPDAIKKPQNYVLITDGTSIQFFDKVSAKALDVLKDTGQYLFVFPVGKIIEQSEKAIKKIDKE